MSDDKKEFTKQKLTAARQQLLAVVGGLDEAQWERMVYSEEGNWRVSDVLRHLAEAEHGMIRLCELIRLGGEGVRPDFDLNRYNARAVEKAKEKSPAELLADMESNRGRLFAFVDTLEDEDWAKEGRHASLNIMSIEQIMKIIGLHERQHAEDIRKALSH